jgi:hypothetical protein
MQDLRPETDPWAEADAASPWAELTGRALASSAVTLPSRASSDYTPSLRPGEEAKPSKAIEAVVYEFGIRWPCPRDVDPDRYDMRLRDLMRLCAGFAPGLLRKAGDRVAVVPGRPFTLPSAGELHEAADAIMSDRAAMQNAAQRREDPQAPRPMTGGGTPDGKASAARRYNIDNAAKGSPFRWTDGMDAFRIGDPGERRATREDGSVIEPWFGDDKHWRTPKGDEGAWSRCHAAHETHYELRGGVILDTRAA